MKYFILCSGRTWRSARLVHFADTSTARHPWDLNLLPQQAIHCLLPWRNRIKGYPQLLLLAGWRSSWGKQGLIQTCSRRTLQEQHRSLQPKWKECLWGTSLMQLIGRGSPHFGGTTIDPSLTPNLAAQSSSRKSCSSLPGVLLWTIHCHIRALQWRGIEDLTRIRRIWCEIRIPIVARRVYDSVPSQVLPPYLYPGSWQAGPELNPGTVYHCSMAYYYHWQAYPCLYHLPITFIHGEANHIISHKIVFQAKDLSRDNQPYGTYVIFEFWSHIRSFGSLWDLQLSLRWESS